MTKRYFFDLPIYRLLEGDYNQQLDAYVEGALYGRTEEERSRFAGRFRGREGLEASTRDYYWKDFGGPWQFNEVIGYVRLYFFGRQIRGELWWVDAKRIVRTRRKLYFMHDLSTASPVRVPPGSDDGAVYNLILTFVDRVRQRLGKRYLETTLLETVGPYVRWSSLLTKAAMRSHAAKDRPIEAGA
jgi:hypothetical protein